MGSNAGRDININIEIPCDTGGSGNKGCEDSWAPESLPAESQKKRAAGVGTGSTRLEEALKALRPMRDDGLLGPSEVELVERLECWQAGLRAEIDRQTR